MKTVQGKPFLFNRHISMQAAAVVESLQQAIPSTVPGSHMDILA